MRKAKKTYYKAIATLMDSEKVWDVVIYSRYESPEEAEQGVANFVNPSFRNPNATAPYSIVETKIVKA